MNDVQGTALVVVHNTRYTLTRNYADPFGGRRGEVLDTPGDRGFLGKVEDSTGLTSVGARYYDAGLGRFVSVDPVMDLGDPQQWTAYAYANDNPVTFSDPSGLLSWKGAWSKLKKAGSSVGKWVSKNKAELIGGAVGVVVGLGCSALTFGAGAVACAVAGGALAGAITNVVRQSSSGKPFSWRSFATETALGGAGGLLGFGIGAAASRWLAPVANRAVQGAVAAIRGSTSRAGQAVASSARSTVNQIRTSAAQVAKPKPIANSTPKPAAARPASSSAGRPGGAGAADGGTFRSGSQAAPGGQNGPAVSIGQVKSELGRVGMSVRDYDIEYVPEIFNGAGMPAYGNSPHTLAGAPFLGSRGRPLIEISKMGLASMDDAVATIFHEVGHHQSFAAFGHAGTEGAAEAYGQRMLAQFLRRTGG